MPSRNLPFRDFAGVFPVGRGYTTAMVCAFCAVKFRVVSENDNYPAACCRVLESRSECHFRARSSGSAAVIFFTITLCALGRPMRISTSISLTFSSMSYRFRKRVLHQAGLPQRNTPCRYLCASDRPRHIYQGHIREMGSRSRDRKGLPPDRYQPQQQPLQRLSLPVVFR